MTDTATDDDALHDSVLDEDWLATPPQRSRLRVVLAGLLASSLLFLGGVLTQKYVGADAESTTAAAGAPGGGFEPGSLPVGGLPAGAEDFQPGGAGGSGDTGDQADSAQAVIGTVVEVRAGVWVVEDLGGERHKVRVTDQSDVVRETRISPDRVAVGDSVDISGSSTDGPLEADQVTLR